MNRILHVNFLKRRAPTSLLGLSLDSGRLEGVVLRRSNGSLQASHRFSGLLSLDPLTNDPELAGREILNQLEAAGVRERRCVVAIPLKWALAAHTAIPSLPDADVASYLQIEAERGFPTDISTLQVATSRLVSAAGGQYATFIGIPKGHVERLERVLRLAKLKPLSFSLGITALQPARAGDRDGVLTFVIGESQVGLQVTCGGGVAALRAIEGAMENESGARVLHSDVIAREARITLGQLPAELRDSVKTIRIFGSRDRSEPLANEIRSRFESGGLKLEVVASYPPDEFGKTIPPDTAVSAAFSLVARQLTGRDDPFEFLPPKVSAWRQATSKYAPGRLRKAGAAVGAVVLIVLALFAYQQLRLASYRSRWRAMAPQVNELTGIQSQIQKYSPWFDDSFRYLTMMKRLTGAFTEDGTVTAKTLTIHDLTEGRDPTENRGMSSVSISGTTDNYAAMVNTYKLLGAIPGVTNPIYSVRGKSPMTFSYDFQIMGGNPR